MDPDSGTESQKALSLQWKSYKLVQDPALRRVNQKIYRYDGVHFSVPLDEFYVGQIPLKEVTFARLNDNIKEPFLAEMCAKFGEVEEMEILFHPKTRKHLGLARVLFTSTRGAKDTVKQLHNTSVMGNIIHAQLDIKGQQRQKYYDLIVSGSFTPQTVPLGGKALTERLPPPQPPTQPDTSSDIRRRLSSEMVVLAATMPAPTPGSITPCSSEPGFTEQRLDTPPSSHTGPFTPGSSASSQGGGTPYMSRSGTPFSQDSGYAGAGRHAGYTAGALVSRYPEEPQEPSGYHRGRPMYPPHAPPYRHNEPPCYPMYPNAGPPGPHTPHHIHDRDRDRDGEFGSQRYNSSYRSSSNSMSPPPSSYSAYPASSKEPGLAAQEPPPSAASSRLGGVAPERCSVPGAADKDYHTPMPTPTPPPAPPPLPPASVIAAAVAETLGSLDFGQDSPVREEQWTKPKRRPSTPPAPPKTPPASPPHSSRDSSSPEPDSTNESLPFVYHSSSLDSRIEMLLKEQKAKFYFLGSWPGIATVATPSSSSTYSPHVPTSDDHQAGLPGARGAPQEEATQPDVKEPQRTGARTPPYNGQSQSSPHSSGEDMEISDEDEAQSTITTVTGHQPPATSASSPSQSSQAAQRAVDPSSSPLPLSDSTQRFGASMHPPIPSYLPPPPPGYSLQPPHMELHPEYPPPMAQHMYDYASSVELMSQYSGGPPMSFQMQTQMLSRLHQLRVSSSSALPGDEAAPPGDYPPPHPPSSYHLHSMPPHHPYMDQDGAGGTVYDQDHHYMPPHMAPYTYPDPHASQLPQHHGIPPPPHAGWPPHVLPPHYPSYPPPPGYATATLPPGEAPEYGAPGDEPPPMADSPHEATVQLALATLIQEMKNIMQRDLNRKMVENIAFATFDEWWERKETKAKPFQTMVRGVSAMRDEEKKEEKASRPREPLMSLVDWAKSGGLEGFSLRGALRLPSFKVKRKEPQELTEEDMKRPRPSTPPDEDDEGADSRRSDREHHGPERGGGSSSKSRKRKPRNRKPWELDSEGEETSDGSSSEKEEEESGKESEDDALSADSDDESLSSESATAAVAAVSKAGDRPAAREQKPSVPTKRPPSPPYPRPSSPVVLVPPLKKRRKTVSFSNEEANGKALPPTPATTAPSPQQGPGDSPLLSPARPPDSPLSSAHASPAIQLLPFASKPGEGNALTVPPPGHATAGSPDDHKKTPAALVSPQSVPGKLPWKRGKESPKSPGAAPVMVCLTVQNLPLDHSSMCRMAFEEAPPPPPSTKRGRGRSPVAPPIPYQGEEEESQLKLREQLGVSSLLQLASVPAGAHLSVLADAALKMDPDAGDSEETETSDEAEEQRMDEELFLSPEPLTLVMDPEGVVVLTEHNYSKPPVLLAPAPRRSSLKQDSSLPLPAELASISGPLEAPEEVIDEAPTPRGDAGEDELSPAATGLAALTPPSKRKGASPKELPLCHDSEEDVDVEELESGELSSSSTEDEGLEEDVRKSERLFLQEAGVTTSQRQPKSSSIAPASTTPGPGSAAPPPPVSFDTRSEYEQMTILYDIWNSGLDTEDLLLLKTTYEKMLQEDHRTDWLNDTHWVTHTNILSQPGFVFSPLTTRYGRKCTVKSCLIAV
ncbi:hypothetical protein NHX12_031829 [Muraenolepis orangiensis]|uniref:RRM domain-containing protein n=1 Tax=Muraenolepis orangiensis TaxID=630683 RepID=A0A9Q0E6B8_9TELE|nr:hypothetical protein NHX12_031829 [Muraenolepis orangiensis]